MNVYLSILLTIATVLLIIACIGFVVWKVAHTIYQYFWAPIIRIPMDISGSGFDVPVSVIYTGTRAMGNVLKYFTFGKNNFNPKLQLFQDHLDYRLFWTQSIPWGEIEYIDSGNPFTEANIVLYFLNQTRTISIDVYRTDNVRELLKFFQGKNIRLSDHAQEIMRG